MADGGYPKLARERQALRREFRAAVMARVEREALRIGRSIKCGEYGHHAGGKHYDGCKNDGSNCICECHDKEASRG